MEEYKLLRITYLSVLYGIVEIPGEKAQDFIDIRLPRLSTSQDSIRYDIALNRG